MAPDREISKALGHVKVLPANTTPASIIISVSIRTKCTTCTAFYLVSVHQMALPVTVVTDI